MKQRYSKWLEETVCDMTEEQENYLVQNGFQIVKPELKVHDDGIVRDMPHQIVGSRDECANLLFNRITGKFYIIVNHRRCNSVEDIAVVKSELDQLTRVLQGLQKL